ncbi:MAG: Asp-tRNA(Asn)/Glu-tRNA(Gln) amidotransferase subunit GatC [Chlorobi bacterium]|nr:Asp-tRNA(Asn)/Glu-tRNA(Gln) amidotransferase subunit GatC [Chlorobiota bacterium]
MEINDDLLDKLAFLARLRFSGQDRERLKQDMSQIIDLVNKLNELNLDEVEPLTHISQHLQEGRNDEPQNPLDKRIVLENAPLSDSDYIKVPPVINKSEE